MSTPIFPSYSNWHFTYLHHNFKCFYFNDQKEQIRLVTLWNFRCNGDAIMLLMLLIIMVKLWSICTTNIPCDLHCNNVCSTSQYIITLYTTITFTDCISSIYSLHQSAGNSFKWIAFIAIDKCSSTSIKQNGFRLHNFSIVFTDRPIHCHYCCRMSIGLFYYKDLCYKVSVLHLDNCVQLQL